MNDTIIDGRGTFHWLFVSNYSKLVVMDMTINGCVSKRISGGAISIIALSQAHFIRTRFTNNMSAHSGGALFFEQSKVNITTSIFRLNWAQENGGSIFSFQSVLMCFRSTFISNRCQQGKGGAISMVFSNSTITYSQFFYNKGVSSGGIHTFGLVHRVSSCLFQSNNANGGGAVGAFYMSFLRLDNNVFFNNTANFTGGAMFVATEALVTVLDSLFSDNYAPNCGIIESHAFKALTIERSIFANGIWVVNAQIGKYDSFCMMNIQDCYFYNLSGPVILADSISSISLTYCKFDGIFSSSVLKITHEASVHMVGAWFVYNNVDDIIVIQYGSTVTMDNSIFYLNNATSIINSKFRSNFYIFGSQFYLNRAYGAIITGTGGYNIRVVSSYFMANNGVNRGCIYELDQTGTLTSNGSLYEGNRAVWGTILYATTSLVGYPSTKPFVFSGDAFRLNIANRSSLFHYNGNYTNKLIFNDVESTENVLSYGYDPLMPTTIISSFTVYLEDDNVVPNVPVNINITVYDQLGHQVLGRSDMSFFVIPCDNVLLQGRTVADLFPSGQASFHDLHITGMPGTNCNLTFLSMPYSLKPVTKMITFILPPHDQLLVQFGGVIFYGLHQVKVSRGALIVLGVFNILVLLLALVCTVITFIYRKSRVIRYSNPLFLYIVLLGCILSLVGSGVFYLTKSRGVCLAQFIIFPISTSLVVCSVLVKQFSMWRLLEDIQYMRETNVENSFLIKSLALLLIIPVISVVLSGIFLNGRTSKEFDLSDPASYYIRCNLVRSEIFIVVELAYLLVCLIIGCYLVYTCRKYRSFPGTFNEATYVGLLLYNYLIIITTTMPLTFSFNGNPTARFLILEVALILFVSSTIILIFFPKFNFLWRNKAIIQSVSIPVHYGHP
ncbi:hypothetical protein SAMD00019534_029300 [Acytostelium subglobosum LB1]|uniref:hypothetical protein n=1 Tax=Acytostelium subglobosum LB1 TaxID=1410327 RepID=UPI000644A506|nr:hypothetical protein SAMD00019534_029300 [Acytostelium subglobosum LB1]GAM19755.1 hypothetical protein SAMD00019534_029300 [Acytostelium subglobosum LB1]|eukprot:XP_012756517.1 hypothetical protein SAMD00019534_029300 [Acytostelium subglobosum LB1]